LYRRVRLNATFKFLPTATTNFYIHHFGEIDIAEIAPDGMVVAKGIAQDISIIMHPDGLLEVDLSFLNCHPTLSIGCSKSGAPVYAGTGADQFVITSILIETYSATPQLSAVPAKERIVLVDVGAQEGIQLKWMLEAPQITPIVFEPIPSEAASIRQTLLRIPGAQVLESALAHVSGTQNLYITAASGCSSLREPNFDILKRYSIGWIFKVVDTRQINCTRYDELFRTGLAPIPDVIKADVQGLEYEVLVGFGSLLQDCLAIELETHLTPLYRGQKLTGDIIHLLEDFGFVLRELRKVPNFDGDAIEFDAVFTKRSDIVLALPEPRKRKFSVISQVLRLDAYF
jgi:FkbM family methyltransferase